MNTNFVQLPLHHAVLNTLEVFWKEALCRVHVSAFVRPDAEAAPHVLEFHGISRVTVPRTQPWGASIFISSVSELAGPYRIEVQSGDEIEVAARGFRFTAI